MLGYYSDWKDGHTPVTTGRAPWLPGPFLYGMRIARSAIAAAESEAFRIMKTKHSVTGNAVG